MTQPKQMVIIGAGPAGISIAVEAVNAGIPSEDIIIIEKAEAHSYSIRKLYQDKKVVTANFKGKTAVCHGVMCISDMSKRETISYLDQAIDQYKLNVHYQEEVNKIHQEKDQGFLIETNKKSFISKTCVIAIGIFGKPKKPDYPRPATLRNFVHFDLTSKEISGPRVLVVGGGDSASEYVQYMVEIGLEVTLSYRRDNFQRMNHINRKSIHMLKDEKRIKTQLNSNIEAVEDQNGKPVVIFKEEELAPQQFDNVIYALGGTTPENFLKVIGIEFDGKTPVVKEGYETSVQGLFLVGDLSAGRKGGSIISAFNSAHFAMKKICENHLECKI
jgi:thioredoxin reductase (NADPH)